MMAPVCSASRLPRALCLSFVTALFLCIYLDVSALLCYDRQALLNIRDQITREARAARPEPRDWNKPPPPVLSGIPAYLRLTSAAPPRKNRSRRRGRRGGLLVKLKIKLSLNRAAARRVVRWLRPVVSVPPVTPAEAFLDRHAAVLPRPPLFPALHAAPTALTGPRRSQVPTRWRSLRRCGRGVDHSSLHLLKRTGPPSSNEQTLQMALINVRSLASKTFMLNDFFISRELDFLFLCETWVSIGENMPFSELLPPDCNFFNSPRATGRGGGVASVYKSFFHCRQIPHAGFASFELQLFELILSFPVLCAVVYRPPKFNKDFIHDFADFLSGLMVKYDHIIICGDFNVHVCCESQPLTRDFLNLLDSFSLKQAVSGPTHDKGHTLDLVLSYGVSVSVDEICAMSFSDHSPILFSMSVPCSGSTSSVSKRVSRLINPSTAGLFSAAFNDSPLCRPSLGLSSVYTADKLLSMFSLACTGILDSVAPFKHKRTKAQSSPWLNDATRDLRRACRGAERKWQKDRLHVSLQILRSCLADYHRAVKTAKSQYISSLVSSNSHKPQVLFNTLNSLINPRNESPVVPSPALCEGFLKFFIEKIAALRPSDSSVTPLPALPPLPQPAVLEQFEPITLSSLSNAVRHLQSSNCPSDCLPSRLLKDPTVLDTVAPFLLLLINTIFSSGCVPAAFKHAVVQPLLKKPNLDPSILSNFRPISKLPFLSKVLEREVYVQLQSFLINNNIYEKFQSGFRTAHSTETALLRVLNDLLLSADSGSPVILVLLDLTAAFDTVDHRILLSRLEHLVGIKGTALKFFQSYLANRCFSVQLGDSISSVAPFTCGVPQGSILGPILFLLYVLPLGEIMIKHNISFHCFADDVQLYLPLKVDGQAALLPLLDCLADIKAWLGANFLNLNESKTEAIVFGKISPAFYSDALGPLASNIRPSVRNLGVIFDSAFKFQQQVSAVVRKSFFHLRTLAKVKAYLPQRDLERVIHAFITSQLDYCNALYTGIDQSQLRRLQLVQNSAARLLTCTKKRDHITPVLASLHWLPIRYRIDFKLLLTVYKSLHGLAPTYLSDILHHHIPSRALRSADQLLLEVPRTRQKTRGDRAFAVAAPRLWNCLPLHIRAAQSLNDFKSQLKTHLFSLAFD